MIEKSNITDSYKSELRFQHKESAVLKGVFHCDVKRNGVLIETIHNNNLIVDDGKHEVARLIGGARTTGITKIGLGSGSAAPAAGDTTLTNLYTKAMGTIEYPANGQVRFNWFIDYGESNGLSVREFGLFFSDDTLFARFVRGSAIVKDSDITLEGQWTIYT